ncbi:hypothetical protein BU16DRAFT_87860 [Lophium mytilinum]|uniref:Uncharacterized protein n=1 Tax=Lophium mytilinum TaxID=390894 RepID=A0A6A6QP40_9PEZI|nr:hypothetical protein BU16DRAFT_87860 [Lophium mytilinum]
MAATYDAYHHETKERRLLPKPQSTTFSLYIILFPWKVSLFCNFSLLGHGASSRDMQKHSFSRYFLLVLIYGV